MRRVHWMELFFDLVFVVFVGQLAHYLHGAPGAPQFIAFIFIFAIGWWAWINMTVTINVLPNLPERQLATVMLLGMLAVGAMAVAAPEAVGDRAWLFAFGCGALRLVMLPLWFVRAKRNHVPLWSPLVYNGVTAGLWIASAFLPQPWQFGVWIAAVAIEVALTALARANNTPLADELQVPHLAERLGLFVIIVMGESVFSVIQALSAHLRLDAGLAAGLGMVLIGALAWTYFIHSAPAFEAGLAALLKARDIIALRDVGMFLPFVLVAGVTMIAAGLATAVEHPESRLSLGALIALFGGLAGFFVAVGLVGIRMHRATRRLIPWMILGAALPVLGLTITLAGSLSATFAVALATAAVAAMTVYAEVQARMPLQLVGQAR